MFFTLLGIAIFCYGLLYALLLCFVDCDLQLAFYEKFGKSVSQMRGKVVFITGASSGIGKHTAIALAKHGVKLVLAARREAELEEVKGQCIATSKGKLTSEDVLVLPMDMLDISSHKKMFGQAVEHFGHIDILLNNAGRSQRADWEAINIQVDKQLFELDVFSTINLTRIAVRYFKTQNKGHVAVNSSIVGVFPFPYSGTYCGAKHALHGYYNTLRIEKRGTNMHLCVTVFCPGPTFSNFLQECFTDRPGEKYGTSMKSTDRRMTAERCGELIAVTLANEMKESWMGLFPFMPLAYLYVYFPNFLDVCLKVIGPQRLYKLRDSKDSMLTEEKTE